MKFEINDSPALTMAEITKLLFNQNFLSDVRFVVNGKIIFAHSLELMKRSIVFQKELATTLGEMKLIPINYVSYDNVYQFIRFIYTDTIEITNSNAIDLLKLARRYKVVKLQNEIICVISGVEINLCLYEYCLLENDPFYLRRAQFVVQNNMKECLVSNQFVQLHATVVKEILRSDYSNASEMEILKALTQWIGVNSKKNKIKIEQQYDEYKHLIQLIRFPVIPKDELLKCKSDYRHLLNESVLDSFKYSKKYAESINLRLPSWNVQPRIVLPQPYGFTFENNPTIFTVTQDILLVGIRFGGCRYTQTPAELTITGKNLATNVVETLPMSCPGRVDWVFHQFMLGHSIRLKPEMEYTINLKWPKRFGHFLMRSRNENDEMFINIPRDCVQFKQECKNIYDLYFEIIE